MILIIAKILILNIAGIFNYQFFIFNKIFISTRMNMKTNANNLLRRLIISGFLMSSLSVGAQSVFKVPVAGNAVIKTCSGTITDDGGTGVYSDNADGSLTIHPGIPGRKVKLEFTQFFLTGWDRVFIYDGTNTSAPLLGEFFSDEHQGTIYANNSTGALTIRFVTDWFDSYEGFEALVSCAANAPQADLIIRNAIAYDSVAIPGSWIETFVQTENIGGNLEPEFKTAVYLSKNPVLEKSDLLLGNSSGYDFRLNIPAGTAIGNYYLIYHVDSENSVNEKSEVNNYFKKQISIVAPKLDLSIDPVVKSAEAQPGEIISLVFEKVGNVGNSNVITELAGYLSEDALLDPADILISTITEVSLAAGDSLTSFYASATIPDNVPAGKYFIIQKVDPNNTIAETNESNNFTSYDLTVLPDYGDLIVRRGHISDSITAGGNVDFSFMIQDIARGGTADASALGVYLSSDANLDNSDDLLLELSIPKLTSFGGHYLDAEFTIPEGTQPGNYFVILKADHTNLLEELSEINNTDFFSVEIGGTNSSLKFDSAPEEGFAAEFLTVYPNPSEGRFTVSLDGSEGVATVSIIDATGKMIEQRVVQNADSHFDLSVYPEGIYAVKVEKNGKQRTTKVVVK